jgi:hypothetical protein
MREDMYKVIVERPRRGKEGDAIAARLRKDLDGPMRLGTRAGYGYRSFNENLAPLRRCAATCTHRLGALGTRCSARSAPVSTGVIPCSSTSISTSVTSLR